jgi:hypothetical protein
MKTKVVEGLVKDIILNNVLPNLLERDQKLHNYLKQLNLSFDGNLEYCNNINILKLTKVDRLYISQVAYSPNKEKLISEYEKLYEQNLENNLTEGEQENVREELNEVMLNNVLINFDIEININNGTLTIFEYLEDIRYQVLQVPLPIIANKKLELLKQEISQFIDIETNKRILHYANIHDIYSNNEVINSFNKIKNILKEISDMLVNSGQELINYVLFDFSLADFIKDYQDNQQDNQKENVLPDLLELQKRMQKYNITQLDFI